MKNEEIKKSWEKIKRSLKKENTLFSNCTYVMNVKQLAKRTATICVANSNSYEYEINRCEESIEEVKGFEEKGFWSHESVQKSIKIYLDREDELKSLKEKYGTKENYVKTVMTDFMKSNAFKVFCSSFENVDVSVEDANNAYYIRLYYR